MTGFSGSVATAVLSLSLGLIPVTGGPDPVTPAPQPATPAAASVTGAPPTTTGSSGVPHPDHIVVVTEENEDASSVLDGDSAPFLDSLATRGANLTAMTAETHPSQPNYLAMFSGDMHGVDDDSCLHRLDAPNLASELLAAGKTFVGYSEGLPRAGFTGCTGGDGYAQKHSPWAAFGNVPASANQPWSAWPKDLSQLPSVAFVTPNLCHDMHDCDVATGDDWLRENLGTYATWAQTHNSWLVVTWDEASDSSPDNRIATLIVGEGIKPGDDDEPADHYRLLRTITDAEGIPPIGQAASIRPLTGIFGTAGGALGDRFLAHGVSPAGAGVKDAHDRL